MSKLIKKRKKLLTPLCQISQDRNFAFTGPIKRRANSW